MIIVDSRVGSKEIAPLLKTPNRLEPLEFGDFSFIGNGPDDIPLLVGIERKGVIDLIQSMESGRLTGHQVPGMLNSFNRHYLLVEGITRTSDDGILEHYRPGKNCFEWRSTSCMARSVYNFLASIEEFSGFRVILTSSPKETAIRVDYLFGYWQKKYSEHKSHFPFQQTAIPFAAINKPTLATRIAAELPGVGPDKARLIGRKFPTVELLVTATVEDLADIKGIGPKTAKKIVDAIKGI